MQYTLQSRYLIVPSLDKTVRRVENSSVFILKTTLINNKYQIFTINYYNVTLSFYTSVYLMLYLLRNILIVVTILP